MWCRLTTRCSGRGPINCTARGRLVSCGRVNPLALLPVGEPPLNLDVRRHVKNFAFCLVLLSALLAVRPSSSQLLDPSRQPSRLGPYTQCSFGGGLAPVFTERAPNLPMARPVNTPSGQKRVSVADGYRVILAFPNTDPFVNLKIEVSVAGRYTEDKKAVLEQMQAFANSANGVSMTVERSTLNGVDVAGLNNPSIQSSQISFYSLFDDKETMIVTAYILNQGPERRAFNDLASYKKLRNAFIQEYTQCMARNRRK